MLPWFFCFIFSRFVQSALQRSKVAKERKSQSEIMIFSVSDISASQSHLAFCSHM